MKNSNKVIAGIVAALTLTAAPITNADVVFGVTGSGNLIESDSWESLMNATNHINHGQSSVGWNWTNRFFMADGHVYGVNGLGHLMEYDSVIDLWNGVNAVDHGVSSKGWSRAHQFFAHDGEYFGVTMSGTLVRASSALNLWNGVYLSNYGDIPNGWDADNSFLLTSEGLYGLSNNSSQYYWSEGAQLQYGGAASVVLGPQSSFGWSYNNQFFGDNSMDGIALNAQGEFIDASAPLTLSTLGLLGVLVARRKRPA